MDRTPPPQELELPMRSRAHFVEEALAADRAIEAGAEVYAAGDVHEWIGRLARGERAAWPAPTRRADADS